MIVKALIKFNDYLEGVTREIGDTFEVSEERYDEILTKGGFDWIEKVEGKPTKTEPKKPIAKKTPRKSG